MSRLFLIGRLYRASPAEISHCGSDPRTERETFVDYVLLDDRGGIIEVVDGLIIEKENNYGHREEAL